MSDFFKQVASAVLAGMILAGGGYYYGHASAKDQYERRFRDAPTVYVSHLGNQINAPLFGDGDAILVRAEAIISTRDDLRSTVTGLGKLLNSDIDYLATEVQAEKERRAHGNSNVRPIEERLQVLREKWPVKQDQAQIEVRKLMAELGLEIAK